VATVLGLQPESMDWATTVDIMGPYACVAPDAPLSKVLEQLQTLGITQIPVVRDGHVVGLVGEPEMLRAYVPAVRTPSEG